MVKSIEYLYSTLVYNASQFSRVVDSIFYCCIINTQILVAQNNNYFISYKFVNWVNCSARLTCYPHVAITFYW